MSHYLFSLKNYHAISQADIRIDGITVIAGCNGSGKSTLIRWLYALVNYASKFENILDKKFTDQLNDLLFRMYRITRNTKFADYHDIRRFAPLVYDADMYESYDGLIKTFEKRLRAFVDSIEDIVSRDQNPHVITWLKSALGTDDNLFGSFTEDFYNQTMERAHSMAQRFTAEKNACRLDSLVEFIQEEIDFIGDAPKEISLKENGLDLLQSDRFISPLDLTNAVYIDTPTALSLQKNTGNAIWDRFMHSLTTPLQAPSREALAIARRIRRIIGGNIVLDNDSLSRDRELRYVRDEDNLDIPVNEAATGLKTFAYMLRLIENGYLEKDALLLIDEPEAHLHPQWIVEFARILVLLHKNVGTKILIASHNPDMIAAIQAVAKAEALDDATAFYQAHRVDDTQTYSYKYLGDDISDIFRSFNIALERIKDYGC